MREAIVFTGKGMEKDVDVLKPIVESTLQESGFVTHETGSNVNYYHLSELPTARQLTDFDRARAYDAMNNGIASISKDFAHMDKYVDPCNMSDNHREFIVEQILFIPTMVSFITVCIPLEDR